MNTLTHPQAHDVSCTKELIVVTLLDGRTISAPLNWFPKLYKANQAQLDNWQLLGEGEDIYWPDINEDLSVIGLLYGSQ